MVLDKDNSNKMNTYFSMMSFNKITQTNFLPKLIIPPTSFHISGICIIDILHVSMAKICPFTNCGAKTASIISSSPKKQPQINPNTTRLEHQTEPEHQEDLSSIEYLYDNQSLKSIHLKTIDQDSCKFSLTHRSWKVRSYRERLAKAIIESIKEYNTQNLK